ncbi:MAG TPA: hypothetical protein VK025_05995 [Steroidobacter sp.]|jgi:hypothetical protein|nr:hypothetical protein [Steroidobacteraceae bacterium]HLS80938.1 hypothetical protein [Steroidobacter sp.]
MSQHSEDRIEQSAPESSDHRSARILPFERPQSDLQRAVQLRAQETMEIERDRDRQAKKPAPLRWAVILLIAMAPVVLIFGAVDAFLRVFQKVNLIYASPPQQEQTQPPPERIQQQPGVVILQPVETRPAEPKPEAESR